MSDLPGMLQLYDGISKQRWPHTMDAKVWAEEWRKTISEHPDIPLDDGAMIGWFASAIMAGYDTARAIAAAEKTEGGEG